MRRGASAVTACTPLSTWHALGWVVLFSLTGCATLQQLAALRNVEFALDRVSDLRLAGVDLGGIQSVEDLSVMDAGRFAMAVSRNELPLEFNLHILAVNPDENGTDARLVQMDWTLLLQERETLSGVLDREIFLPPGQPIDVPLAISLDLMEFFQGNAQDLLELALSISDQGGAPKEVALKATPTIQTPLGPIRYPQPITILSREVGNQPSASDFALSRQLARGLR